MDIPSKQKRTSNQRRQRLHDLLIALISQQTDVELLEHEEPIMGSDKRNPDRMDPATWLTRNKRIMGKYQALIRSAITLDALLDAEESHPK